MLQFVLVKAFKTHSAALVLCRKGYVEDALVLLRTLLELAIDVRYVLKNQREELVARWWYYDVVERYESVRALRGDPSFMGSFDGWGEDDPTLKNLKEEAKEAQKRWGYWRVKKDGSFGFPHPWPGKDKTTRALAHEVGWGSLYNTLYKLTSILGHSSSRSAVLYTEALGDRGLRISTAPDAGRTQRALEHSFALLHSTVRNWVRLTNPPDPLIKGLKDTAARFLDIAAKRENLEHELEARRALMLQADIDEHPDP
jgi:hypothetical protein